MVDGVVYMITNKKNGRAYIGKTINYKTRVPQHLSESTLDYYPKSEFYLDVAKQRKEGELHLFVFRKLCVCNDKIKLHELENKMLNAYRAGGVNLYNKKFNTTYPKTNPRRLYRRYFKPKKSFWQRLTGK